ncbi:MAG: hypothetical protein D4R95_00465 [Actinobacteria bacterium]|nr:MAG: hypothetical protein D4R95_00465 [Actinomycetota bacterium]
MNWVSPLVALVIIVWLVRRSRKRAKATTTSKQNMQPVHKRDMAIIDAEITMVTDEIDFFSTYKDHDAEHATDSIVLQQDEHLLATLSVVGLIENNQTEDGAEPELLDEGEFIVTTVRGVFVGKSVTHDFQWSKLVSHKTEPLMNNVVVYLPVSNRQKIYGIAADSAGIANMQRRLAFGVAVALGRNEQYVDGLKAEREKLLKEKQQLGVIH